MCIQIAFAAAGAADICDKRNRAKRMRKRALETYSCKFVYISLIKSSNAHSFRGIGAHAPNLRSTHQLRQHCSCAATATPKIKFTYALLLSLLALWLLVFLLLLLLLFFCFFFLINE